MTGSEILDRFRELGVEVELIGDQVQVTPVSVIPRELLAEAKTHKQELIDELTVTYGDGQPPPLDRPPETEEELRRWMDYTADPKRFAERFDWAMKHFDPSEGAQKSP